jgi:hypothetical protein
MSRLGRLLWSRDDTRPWKGAYAPYDLVKELCIAVGAITLLALVLTVLFSSPDIPPVSIEQWAHQMPVDFVTTATAELDGTSETAEYGPPYNHNSGSLQHAAFLEPEKWIGVSHPVNAAQNYVIEPLKIEASEAGNAALGRLISTYQTAPAKTQAAWSEAYAKALEKASVGPDHTVVVPPGEYGPVAPLMSELLVVAQSGDVEGDLIVGSRFFQTDYTKALLFLEDGEALETRAKEQHLLGEQWGMMNETGSYPGQAWLWLYALWYQVEPFKMSVNADLLVMLMMTFLSLAFICIPVIPGIRDLPRWIPIHKLIWKEHYRALSEAEGTTRPRGP